MYLVNENRIRQVDTKKYCNFFTGSLNELLLPSIIQNQLNLKIKSLFLSSSSLLTTLQIFFNYSFLNFFAYFELI